MSIKCSRLTAKLTVSELLSCWPETAPIFIRHRMACIGCSMSQFETLEGATAVYGLDLDSFVCELEQVLPKEETEERKK
jgi:hybrid cluster-associated redox disulfide protein